MKLTRFLVCCTIALSGCAFIIPPDNNAPRNNIVVGEPHRPQLNNAVGPQSLNAPRQLQPVAQNAMPALPPVDTATQAQAQSEMATANAPDSVDTSPLASLPTPAAMPAPLPNDRHIPSENAQYQTAANDYPPLNNVPPRPVTTGPDSTQAHLTEVKAGLEKDRAAADASKAALTKDAAAEPSMLSGLPKTEPVVPPNDPVTITPVAPEKVSISTPEAAPAPVSNAVRQAPVAPVVVPHVEAPITVKPVAISEPKVTTANSMSPLPATPDFAPPAPRGTPKPVVTANVAPLPLADSKPQPSASYNSAPAIAVQPLPPVTTTIAAAAPVAPAPAIKASPAMRAGDFDPLAAADNAPVVLGNATSDAHSVYGSNSNYLAPSRYADRRY